VTFDELLDFLLLLGMQESPDVPHRDVLQMDHVERRLDGCIMLHFHHIQNAGPPRHSKIDLKGRRDRRSLCVQSILMASVSISKMVTVVVGGEAKAAMASGIDIGYAVYFFLSVAYR
jgi:hypothetical protein